MRMEELKVSPFNRGMMYGDGCFETFRSYKGKFLDLKAHYDRYTNGLKYLGIRTQFEFIEFKNKVRELLRVNELLESDAWVRIQCWRDGERGYATESDQSNWVFSCAEIISTKETIKLASVSLKVIPQEALCRNVKLSNSLNYILAAREAVTKGADDALMFTINNKISETSIANIFWTKEDRIFTPTKECDLLAGITRTLILKSISQLEGIEIVEGEFEEQEILDADAVFVTNSIKEIQAVSSIDSKHFDIQQPLFHRIREAFNNLKTIELK